MKYSYYPGCTLKTKARELDAYARLSAAALGIELAELPEWQCCGAVYPQASDEIATRLSAVRALASAGKESGTLVTMCSACHHVLKRTNHDIAADGGFRSAANNYLKLDEPYAGKTRVVHFLELLRDEVGFAELKKAVKKPLTGRKIAAYYGCLLLRPSGVMAFDDPENPSVMEELIHALGAEPVIYPYRNECCGGYIALENRAQAAENVAKIVSSAAGGGAGAIITACPLCMYNLRENAEKDSALPVLYFTELLAEALGVKEEKQHE